MAMPGGETRALWGWDASEEGDWSPLACPVALYLHWAAKQGVPMAKGAG